MIFDYVRLTTLVAYVVIVTFVMHHLQIAVVFQKSKLFSKHTHTHKKV